MAFWRRNKKLVNKDIYPDEIFLDSKNLPEFDQNQFEGRLEKPISMYSILLVGAFFILISLVFTGKLLALQIVKGDDYEAISENNRLQHTLKFAKRGVIFDRRGEPIAWNSNNPDTEEFSLRSYLEDPGLSQVLGYIKYPSKDSSGFYYQTEFVGVAGVEKTYDHVLAGTNGLKITETDALGKVLSESVIEPPEDGKNLTLTIDSRLQIKLYDEMLELSKSVGFTGGAAVLMDVHNGGILALVSFPEFDSNILSTGEDRTAINAFLNDKNNPFLDRAISGLYTPGSIVKPYLALGALQEGIVTPTTKILSTGSISIPNPYFPDKKTVFNDWKAHGWVDVRQAIAVSSDVYFYEIGGGFENQKGLGIAGVEKYFRMFGFGVPTGVDISNEGVGTIPNPEWKKKVFPDDPTWRIGDTYNTSIGQYGVQATPLQAARAVASVANDGTLLTPTLVLTGSELENSQKIDDIDNKWFKVVKEGMREGVKTGTASALNVSSVDVAAKTGTAELGVYKQFVNSWVTGFFPYDHPNYAFAVVMEKGPRSNLIGASYVMRQFLDWMAVNTPEYLN